MTQFSDSGTGYGIAEQTLSIMRVDSTQWPLLKIANSCNHWSDFITGYAIGADARFQWDNTNHTKLPEGTTDLTSAQSDYSFLTDEQGNSILTLTGISVLRGSYYEPLKQVDRNDVGYNADTYGQVSAEFPTSYDKISDNIIRLDVKPSASISAGLKFYFQRTSPRFDASSTTATTGFAPILDRGFIVASAYDGAFTLGLTNVGLLAGERSLEVEKVKQYFAGRNNDERPQMTMRKIKFK